MKSNATKQTAFSRYFFTQRSQSKLQLLGMWVQEHSAAVNEGAGEVLSSAEFYSEFYRVLPTLTSVAVLLQIETLFAVALVGAVDVGTFLAACIGVALIHIWAKGTRCYKDNVNPIREKLTFRKGSTFFTCYDCNGQQLITAIFP